MKIIRLSKSQTQWTAVNDPLFESKIVRTDEENESLVKAYAITKSTELREELILCNLHLVEHTVGRYLANWPETRRWKDDMVSVGVETLIRRVDAIDKDTKAEYFRAKAVLHIKSYIEMHLNDSRTSVYASLATNYRRVRQGRPLASIPEHSLDKMMENNNE